MPKSAFTPPHKAFAALLRDARRKAGVTQVELARRLGRAQSLVSAIERGIRRVDVVEFAALARALDLDPVALFEIIAKKLPTRLDVF